MESFYEPITWVSPDTGIQHNVPGVVKWTELYDNLWHRLRCHRALATEDNTADATGAEACVVQVTMDPIESQTFHITAICWEINTCRMMTDSTMNWGTECVRYGNLKLF